MIKLLLQLSKKKGGADEGDGDYRGKKSLKDLKDLEFSAKYNIVELLINLLTLLEEIKYYHK